MAKEQKKPVVQETDPKRKKLRCPFDKDLACDGCRLYQIFPENRDQRVCTLTRIANWMP